MLLKLLLLLSVLARGETRMYFTIQYSAIRRCQVIHSPHVMNKILTSHTLERRNSIVVF